MEYNKKIEYSYFFIDIYNSRGLFKENQKITNRILRTLAKYLNKKFSINLLSNFEVRDGDGVLGGTKNLSLIVDIYEACLEFKENPVFLEIDLGDAKKEEVKFYFGVGIGNITSGEDTYNSVNDINGTAISNAKKASDVAKDIIIYNLKTKKAIPNYVKESINQRGNYYYRWQDFQIYLIADNQLDKLLNPSFYLAYEKFISNKKQNDLFQLKKNYPSMELYNIGRKLGYELNSEPKSKQKLSTQISNLLNKSNFNDQKNLLRDIKIYLKELSQIGDKI